MTSFTIIVLAPLVLLAASAAFVLHPGRRPGKLPYLAEAATLGALAAGLVGLVQLSLTGVQTLTISGYAALRLDVVSVTLALLVGFVG